MQPHDLLDPVVEQLPVGVFALSARGDVPLRNSRAEHLTGWSGDRVRRDGLAGFPPDPPSARRDELLDLVRRGKGLALSDLCEHLVRGTSADTGDDMVVLALRVPA